jgi:thimet oligopeptidase
MNKGFYMTAALILAFGILGYFYKDTVMEKIGIEHHAPQVTSTIYGGHLKTDADLAVLFPHTVQELKDRTESAIDDARKRLAVILAVPAQERTYENTAYVFDQLVGFSPIAIWSSVAELVSMVYTDAAMRDEGREASKKMSAFFVDEISNNKPLYEALKEYVAHTKENLSQEQKYFLKETLDEFKRGGLDLPDDQRLEVAALKKDLADLSIAFEMNVASDNKTIEVTQQELAGLRDDFIANLKKTNAGKYILGTDYPTYFAVMEECRVEETRKRLSCTFENRAYPVNEGVLKAVIAKRDELAHELGYASFADLDLEDQMTKRPQVALNFLDELLKRCGPKELAEFKAMTAELPESVTLTADGKMKSWDRAYVRAQYKKKHFNLDERAVAEYFPMEHTIKSLFDVYQEFLGLSFKIKPATNLWHEDVQVIEAYDGATHKLLGYLLIDLHPRPNKYTHACHGNVVPAVTLMDGTEPYVVSLVIANFPKSTGTKPSLLKRDDVTTFFHEFGHALHGLLGRTKIASCSGTRVKRDFVEMPSQMLEEWMMEKDVLKRVSSHYVTGEPLSDELIKNIISSKHFDTGSFLQRQAYLSLVSLAYYGPGAAKDVAAIMRDISTHTRPHVAYDDQAHMYAAFGHLTNYGPKYYGYMWSKVFALDLFSVIKAHHFSREIGKKYVAEVLSKGGSKDPRDLLVAFLGREPQQDAFFKDMGL